MSLLSSIWRLAILECQILLTFIISILGSDRQENHIAELCNVLRNNLSEQVNLVALSPCDTSLYLVAQEQLYEIPFTDDYINSSGVNSQMALFDRFSSIPIKYHGDWRKVPWLGHVFELNLKTDDHLSLVHMHIFYNPNANTSQTMASLTFRDEDNDPSIEQNYLVDEHTGQVISNLSGSKMHYGVLMDSTGSQHYWLLHDPSLHNPLIVLGYTPLYDTKPNGTWIPGVFKTGSGHHFLFAHFTQDTSHEDLGHQLPHGKILLTATFPTDFVYQPIVSSLPGFGLIYNGSVHVWNMEKRIVIVFPYIASLQERIISVDIVPFEWYFACSETHWTTARSPQLKRTTRYRSYQNATLRTAPVPESSWWLLLVLFACMVIASIIGVTVYWSLKRARDKKQKELEKDQLSPTEIAKSRKRKEKVMRYLQKKIAKRREATRANTWWNARTSLIKPTKNSQDIGDSSFDPHSVFSKESDSLPSPVPRSAVKISTKQESTTKASQSSSTMATSKVAYTSPKSSTKTSSNSSTPNTRRNVASTETSQQTSSSPAISFSATNSSSKITPSISKSPVQSPSANKAFKSSIIDSSKTSKASTIK